MKKTTEKLISALKSNGVNVKYKNEIITKWNDGRTRVEGFYTNTADNQFVVQVGRKFKFKGVGGSRFFWSGLFSAEEAFEIIMKYAGDTTVMSDVIDSSYRSLAVKLAC